MSDGDWGAKEETLRIASDVKQCSKIMITCSLFAANSDTSTPDTDTKEAKSTLSEIASSPNLYKTTYGENDLRQFFVSSMSAKKHSEQKAGSGLCPVCNTNHI